MSFRVGAAVANIAGIALTAGYVRQAAVESARMALALDVTQAVLAREQRLSALGALAAAAAHELGTPLATISIVAKELGREAPTAGGARRTPTCWSPRPSAAARSCAGSPRRPTPPPTRCTSACRCASWCRR